MWRTNAYAPQFHVVLPSNQRSLHFTTTKLPPRCLFLDAILKVGVLNIGKVLERMGIGGRGSTASLDLCLVAPDEEDTGAEPSDDEARVWTCQLGMGPVYSED